MKTRVRLIWPSFFTDATIADLPAPTRLFYVALWTICDDAGYFPWKPREIGAALFPYDAEPARVGWIEMCLEELQGAGRVEHPCEPHGFVPTLEEYRMKGGRPTFPLREEHERTCMHVQKRVVRNERFRFREDDVSTRDVESVGASLDEAAEATGGFVGEIAARRNGKSRPGKAEPAQEGRSDTREGARTEPEHT